MSPPCLQQGGTLDMDETYLPASKVKKRYGVTDMTLWRWLRDPKLGFPAPMIINRRRFWSTAALEQFERARASGKAPEAA
jgi:hypothetical protein